MIRNATLAMALVALVAACGADGEPTPPAKSGPSISGQVRIGVSGS